MNTGCHREDVPKAMMNDMWESQESLQLDCSVDDDDVRFIFEYDKYTSSNNTISDTTFFV